MNNKKIQKDTSESFEGYRVKLSINEENKDVLVSARDEIRPVLRDGLSFDGSPVKFLTQGSFRHQLINHPCHPNQQMDLDDGVYIPNSVAKYKSPAQWLDHVADCLKPLAKSNGWVISTEKPSCVRVVLDEDKHIDIPLYHIPDLSIKKLQASDPSDNVQLARREGWKNSDPRTINEWVASISVEHGSKYKHICRIFKGWRDNQWEDKSPISSIMIMVMVEMAMKNAGIFKDSNEREDEILRKVVDAIVGNILHSNIPDPDPNNADSLNSKWNEKETKECILKFNSLQKALYGECNNDDYVRKLREEFGRFFPTNTSFIKSCKTATKVAAVTATTPLAAAARPFAASRQDYFIGFILPFLWKIKKVYDYIVGFFDNDE